MDVNVNINLLGVLGIVFIVLKLCNVINWSWIWVLCPFWIGIAVIAVFFIGIYLYKIWLIHTGRRL